MFRLASPNDVVGKGVHRSGWPEVLQTFAKHTSPKGILLDDFVERSFTYRPMAQPYREPWMGIFHHPVDVPIWLHQKNTYDWIFSQKLWQESHPNLVAGIALSEQAANYLSDKLDRPFYALKHPTALNVPQFTLKTFKDNRFKKLVQVGSFLRNTELISQIPLNFLVRAKLGTDLPWVKRYEQQVKRYWQIERTRTETRAGAICHIPRCTNSEYDEVLSSNVVCMEFFAASASNAVVECLVRRTPLIVNRLPSIEEYLGKDYPLYFTDMWDITDCLDLRAVMEAHEYLMTLGTTKYEFSYFASKVAEICKYYTP
jgi:hypothetical protein